MNPFRYGEVVTGPDFCPRPQVSKVLREHLEDGHKIVLLGERRTGKTSLIHETVRKMRSTRLVYAQMWAVKSIEDIASRLLRALSSAQIRESSFLERVARSLAHLRPRIDFDPVTGQPSITVTPGTRLEPSGLHGVFDFIEGLSKQHSLVVALDEFQDVAALPDASAILGEIRGRIQTQRGVPYVFAGSMRHEMELIFRNPNSPFYKSLHVIELEGLPRTTFRRFLNKRFAAGKRKVDDATYNRIFEITQDSPSDIQQFCAAIWHSSKEGETIDEGRLADVLGYIFATERKGYEAQIRPLTGIQVQCLKALAKVGGKHPQSKAFLQEAGIDLPATARRAIMRLIDIELIGGAELEHRFLDPFLKEWVLRKL